MGIKEEEEINKPSLRRLARRGGVKRINSGVYEAANAALKVFLENVLRDSITHTEYCKRKTVTTTDVVQGLARQGIRLYVASDELNMHAQDPERRQRGRQRANAMAAEANAMVDEANAMMDEVVVGLVENIAADELARVGAARAAEASRTAIQARAAAVRRTKAATQAMTYAARAAAQRAVREAAEAAEVAQAAADAAREAQAAADAARKANVQLAQNAMKSIYDLSDNIVNDLLIWLRSQPEDLQERLNADRVSLRLAFKYMLRAPVRHERHDLDERMVSAESPELLAALKDLDDRVAVARLRFGMAGNPDVSLNGEPGKMVEYARFWMAPGLVIHRGGASLAVAGDVAVIRSYACTSTTKRMTDLCHAMVADSVPAKDALPFVVVVWKTAADAQHTETDSQEDFEALKAFIGDTGALHEKDYKGAISDVYLDYISFSREPGAQQFLAVVIVPHDKFFGPAHDWLTSNSSVDELFAASDINV
jgi:histone H4